MSDNEIRIYEKDASWFDLDTFRRYAPIAREDYCLKHYYEVDDWLNTTTPVQAYVNRKIFNENRTVFDPILGTFGKPDFPLDDGVTQEEVEAFLSKPYTVSLGFDPCFYKRAVYRRDPFGDAAVEDLIPIYYTGHHHYDLDECERKLAEAHIRPYDPVGYRPVMTPDEKADYIRRHPDTDLFPEYRARAGIWSIK